MTRLSRKNLLLSTTAAALACLFLMSAPGALARSVQDRVTLDRQVRFQRGASSAAIRGRIARGTSHIYRVRARAGQEMAVVLRTGSQTSFTVSGWNSGILEGADGVRQTIVRLPETGEYMIRIGTDRTANYILEITIN